MARDFYHDIVKRALEKDGWHITHDPYELEFGSSTYKIDLGAEGLVGAEREGQLIAVEVKSFLGRSLQHQLHEAVGQFTNYRVLLEEIEPERMVYLAIPENIFQELFELQFARLIRERTSLRLIVFSHQTEEVIQWNP
jgi:XisH protein